jgi:hypothetical protein
VAQGGATWRWLSDAILFVPIFFRPCGAYIKDTTPFLAKWQTLHANPLATSSKQHPKKTNSGKRPPQYIFYPSIAIFPGLAN